MAEILRAFAAEAPLFVVHLGDVGQGGAYQSEALRSAFDELGIPLFVAPGNHDRDPMPPRALSNFHRYLNPAPYAFALAGQRFAILDVSDYPIARAQLLADVCRLNTLYMIMNAGSGHIGSSFSSTDLITWLWTEELADANSGAPNADTYFSSKGHDAPALYALLIALEKLDFDLLHKLRRFLFPTLQPMGVTQRHLENGPRPEGHHGPLEERHRLLELARER